MTRYFTHYWRNKSVDEFIREYGDNAPVEVVYGGRRLLNVNNGDYLYEVTVRNKGQLYVLGRLEVKIVGRREDASPYPGENEDDNQEYQAEAFKPMFLRSDNLVSPELIGQIACIGDDGKIVPLKLVPEGGLDNQTLRGCRELTEASAALLDRVIAEYEVSRVSNEDVRRSSGVVMSWQTEEGGFERRQSTKLVNHYERDVRLRAAAIRIHGTVCQVCGFSFDEVYGEYGVDYIEVHHKRPICHMERLCTSTLLATWRYCAVIVIA